MKANYHVHSHYSSDSVYNMEDVILDAIDCKIEELCFTDHVDYGVLPDHDDGPFLVKDGFKYVNVDYPNYYKDILKYREKYGDKINIKLGLEFGMQTHTIDKYQKLFDSYPFDFIIMSVHQIGDKELWNQEFQEEKSQAEYNEAYYNEIYEVIKEYKDYSVLGHLDSMVRYDKCGSYPFDKIKGIVEKILIQVIKDGKGIELNTSSRRYGLSDLTPSRDILKLYRQLGGTVITIGSDSHKAEHINDGLDQAKVELKNLGFDKFCTFENMKPIYHDL